MFFLVTGASGVGKSTARRYVERALANQIECVELSHVVAIPERVDVAWRRQAAAETVQVARRLRSAGRHLLLSGDPVPPGEVFAAPGADDLKGGAVLLPDASPTVQTARLSHRGDDPKHLPDHLAFMVWMRSHVRDAELQAGHPDWTFAELDTTLLSPAEVGEAVLEWVRTQLARACPDSA